MKCVKVKKSRKEAGKERSKRNIEAMRKHLEKEGILVLLNKEIMLSGKKSQ